MIKIKSPVTWIGNKTSILHILYALFPIGCDRYVEPFGGSGAVLLGKPVPDKFEVFNDYNHNLVNLFRCMRDRPMEFIRELGFLSLNSRDDFAILKKFFEKEEFTEDYLKAQLDLTEILLPEVTAKEVRTLYSAARNDHDLRRAAMFLKLIRYSYSSGCKSFACQPFSLRTLFALVQDFAKRCENVVIENQDFETLIKHYDRPTTFTYCDPPYFTSEYMYDCGFTWEDHLRLYHALAGMKGKFLLSYNDCPEIRELYKEYNFFDFKRVHSMAQKYEAGKEFPELLIANYDLFERERQQPHQLTLFDSIDKPLDYEKILKENIVWGTYGEVLTKKTLNSKAKQYPDEVGSKADFIKTHWLGRRTADCIGLIKDYGRYDCESGSIAYGTNGMPDIGADTMYENATEKGTIDTLPETPGLALWHEGHIGIYIGDGQVIHAANTNDGVILSEVSGSGFTSWLKIPYISYDENLE